MNRYVLAIPHGRYRDTGIAAVPRVVGLKPGQKTQDAVKRIAKAWGVSFTWQYHTGDIASAMIAAGKL